MDSFVDSPVTFGLILLNVVASLAAFANPRFYDENVLWVGAMRDRGEWYRALSSGFLHVNPAHLLLNMYGLFLFGPVVERVLGGVGFALVYLAALAGGSAWAYVHNQTDANYRAAGASGAISGIILAFCLIAPFSTLLLLFVLPMWGIVFGLLYIAVSYLFAQRADRIIGHEAHLGGAVTGLIATLLVRPDLLNRFVREVAERFG